MIDFVKQFNQYYWFLNRCCLALFILVTFTGCASLAPEIEQDSAPTHDINWSRVKPVTPKYEPKSRYGNPVSYEQSGRKYSVLDSAANYKQKGIASWYGTKFHGRRTSSGETYDMMAMTAAHKTLPIPCYAKVTNLETGKQIIVKINDRGPFKDGRIIDLSYAAAHQLEMTTKGTVQVQVETITFEQNVSLKQNTFRISKVAKKEGSRFVQVGAYSVHKTAQKLAKVLDREIHLPVKISSIKRANKKLYRVRIGPVPTQVLAEKLIKILDIKELGKPRIIYD